jgi:PAS domain S-box-containing protein
MKRRLIERGYLVAHSGCDEAPEAHASLRPNLAIVRVVGLVKPHDATGNIEESGGGLNVPAVFLGAPVDLALVRPIKGSNFCGYLLETFDDLELDDLELGLESALDRRRTERNLRESEQWLRAILRSLGHGVVATDAAWRVQFINPAAEELTGWIANEAIGRTLSEVVSVSISAPELIRDGRAQGVLHHRGGKEVPIEESSTTIRNKKGKVIGSVISIGAMADHSRDCK